MVLVDEKKANRARASIHYRVTTGKLTRASHCSKCGKEGKTRAHHEDYNKPLEIIWLCGSCHGKLEDPPHKPKKRGRCNDGRGNRPKTERNLKIMEYWAKGYRQKSIARMFKMKESAVSMVILRESRKLFENLL